MDAVLVDLTGPTFLERWAEAAKTIGKSHGKTIGKENPWKKLWKILQKPLEKNCKSPENRETIGESTRNLLKSPGKPWKNHWKPWKTIWKQLNNYAENPGNPWKAIGKPVEKMRQVRGKPLEILRTGHTLLKTKHCTTIFAVYRIRLVYGASWPHPRNYYSTPIFIHICCQFDSMLIPFGISVCVGAHFWAAVIWNFVKARQARRFDFYVTHKDDCRESVDFIFRAPIPL